tara:strand:+ start:76121 stop:76807 length:687 start_codon:yes stop_codon:yes gene_type:complete
MKQDSQSHPDSQKIQDELDNEALSALMDDELSDFELRRLLARLDADPELLARWERFNLTRAVLSGEPVQHPLLPSDNSQSLHARVMQAVTQEQQPPLSGVDTTKGADGRQNHWRRGVARMAVAASVAVAAFVGMQSMLQPTDSISTSGSVPLASEQVESGSNAVEIRQIAVDADAQQRLNEYIQSVNIPARVDSESAPFSILRESPMLRPVSDRELVPVDSSPQTQQP